MCRKHKIKTIMIFERCLLFLSHTFSCMVPTKSCDLVEGGSHLKLPISKVRVAEAMSPEVPSGPETLKVHPFIPAPKWGTKPEPVDSKVI